MIRLAANRRGRAAAVLAFAAAAGLFLLLLASCSAAKSFIARVWPGQSAANDAVAVAAADTAAAAAAADKKAAELTLPANTALLTEGTRLVQGISVISDNDQPALYARYVLSGPDTAQPYFNADVWFVPEPLLLVDPFVPGSCSIQGATQVVRFAAVVDDMLVYIIETGNYTICAAIQSGFGRDCDFLVSLADRVQYFYTYVAADLSLFSFPSAIEYR
ncbi:MAG: hypothetical protein KKI09_13655 [Spirochaetes bacterium]|nr:hypothetical protein [Spirochaetota bacterium]